MTKKIFLATVFIFSGVLIFPQISFSSQLGEVVSFFVDQNYDAQARSQINASLKKIGGEAYFYIDNDWWNSLGASQQNLVLQNIENLSLEFDQVIFPKMIESFGEIWSPGIDNDPKITILFEKLKEQAGGYFNSKDEFPRTQISNSNEREMVYLNATYLLTDLGKTKAFLAHEFQHLISFYQKEKLQRISDDIWLNEARSEYAATFLGYDSPFDASNLQRRVAIFLANPSDSLTEWKGEQADYGVVNLFSQYLIEHYGKEIIKEMLKNNKVGIESVNEALASLGFQDRFDEIFSNWTIANYLNNCAISINYCYLNPDLNYERVHITFNLVSTYGEDRALLPATAKDWGPNWYELRSGIGILKNILEIKFLSQESGGKFSVPYILQDSQGKISIKFLDFYGKEAKAYIQGFGREIQKVGIIPSSQAKTKDFSEREPQRSYILEINLLESMPVLPSFPDGTLIRARGDTKVYIILGGYKRWIQSPKIFDFYGHLSWDKIVEVLPEERDWYKDSWLIRELNDFKVYEVWQDGTKHWLNMTAEQFLASGRSFGEVYIVNEKERNYYYTGSEIK